MPTQTDPTRRNPTRYRGISYRLRSDGTRQYAVYFRGNYIGVEGGEQDALSRQAELRGQAARGEAPTRPTKLTFAEVAELWLESKHRLRPYTRLNYRATLDRILIPRFGSMKIGAITADHVVALIRDLERQGLAPTTVTDYLKPLSGTMQFAVRRRLINANPCSLLTRDDRPRPRERTQDHVWSDEEIEALNTAAERLAARPEARYDYSALIRTALSTGLRLGELLGLNWADIDLEEGTLYVRKQWTRLGEHAPPKTNAAFRRVPLSADMVSCLRELKVASRFSQDDHPVFASKSGKPLAHRNATGRGFQSAVREAGIDGVSFHSMRHAFASRMIARGISSTVLARLMGHESSAITERRYIHLFDQQRTDEQVRLAMALAQLRDGRV
jgi:integrase